MRGEIAALLERLREEEELRLERADAGSRGMEDMLPLLLDAGEEDVEAHVAERKRHAPFPLRSSVCYY